MAIILINLGVINNTLTLDNADYLITGLDGNNTLTIGNGNNQLILGNGNNTLTLGGGTDQITAGSGNNTVTTSGVGADTISFTSGNNTITVGGGPAVITAGNGLNMVTAGDGNDLITLGNGFDQVTTGNGNSTIIVGNGVGDIITVGTGSNRISLGTGAADIVHTGGGNNVVSVSAAALASDTIMGALTSGNGSRNDIVLTTAGIISLAGVTGFEIFELSKLGANTITLQNANFARLPAKSISIVGGNSGDTINATALSAANSVTVFGGAGNDLIQGGLGDDILVGSAGTNRIDGGAGTNTAIYAGLKSSYQILVYQGSVLIHGSNDSDTLTNIQTLQFANQSVQVASLTLTNTATQVGTVSGYLGTGERDLFLRTGAGQLVQWSYDGNGALVGGAAFTFQGNPWAIDVASTAIGTGQSFWGYGGHDVFLRSGSGQLTAAEFNSAGSALDIIALTYQGNPWVVAATTIAIGVGQGFWGYGGHDVFLRTAAGQLVADEFNNAGSALDSIALTYQGNPWVVAATTTAIGSGQNFWGYGGHDVYLRTVTGQLVVDEFDNAGSALSGIALTYLGTPWIVDGATSVIGSGQNFWDFGGHDVFLRNGTGQLIISEFDTTGGAIKSVAMTYLGSPLTLDASSTVIGDGQNFRGFGGHDVFVRSGSGQLIAQEFDNFGAAVSSVGLTSLGSEWTVDTATTAIGTGQNFWGYGGHDVFLRSGAGQLVADEFDINGAAISGIALTYQGHVWAIDTLTRAIGTGHNFAGSGGNDVFLLNGLGQIGFGEFNAAGVASTAAMNFITSATPGAATVGPTTTVAAMAQNILGVGDQDLLLRELGGQLHVWVVANAQTLTADLALKFGNGSVAAIGITDSVTSAGQNLLGQGGHDIRILTASGQSTLWEFNNAGTITAIG